MSILDQCSNRRLLFLSGLILFAVMAAFGWQKLQYGFNFLDEGMYMTDGWRLAAGDHLFPDASTNVVWLYSLFNEIVFKIVPDITLYGFRKLQYLLALCSIAALAAAISRWKCGHWFLPFALSIYAFTGLDPNGMNANLSYYTYPHFFVCLYIALLLFALKQPAGLTRNTLLVGSGLCMWGIGFSLLPLSVSLATPLILWWLFNRVFDTQVSFSLRDVAFVLAPAAAAWSIFLAVNGAEFFATTLTMYRYLHESIHNKFALFYSALSYLICSSLFLVATLYLARRPTSRNLAVAAAMSAVFYVIIDTNLFGLAPPFWRGWFNIQMWSNSLLIAALMVVITMTLRARWSTRTLDEADQLLVVLVVPSAVVGGAFMYFSHLGPIAVQFVGIPTTAALAIFVVRWVGYQGRGVEAVSLVLLVVLLWPFHYTLARADWEFTYFDLPPEDLEKTFRSGFASGIRTNGVFVAIAKWMERSAQQYSQEGDLALVDPQTPMVYMLIKRRPALNHSWTGLGSSAALIRDALDKMIRNGREPAIAYRFTTAPLMTKELRNGVPAYALGKKLPLRPKRPVHDYLVKNMKYVGTFSLHNIPLVELYVRKDQGDGATKR